MQRTAYNFPFLYFPNYIIGDEIMLAELIKNRHSAVNFVEGFEISESEFKSMIDLLKQAPSTYNLQSTEYLIVNDPVLKDEIYEISYRQHKIKTSSAIIYILGNKDALTEASAIKLYSPMKMLKMISEEDYATIVNQVANFEASLKDNFNATYTELLRVGCFSAGFLVLIAESKGYNTCPMHVVNEPEIRKLLKIPDNLELLMMVTIGKSVDKARPRGYRKPAGELLRFNTYS